jgi:5'-3' exonuclease
MQGIIDADVLVHWAARGSADAESAVEMLHDLMADAVEGSWCDPDDLRIAVKGKGNYRKDVVDNYKANRGELDDELKVKLNAVHRTLVNDYKAIPADGMEADDLVRVWANEAVAEDRQFIIIAEDKDLKCIPGRHYNPKKKILEWQSEDDADLLYHQQLLTGDSADNIQGLYRIGPKKAQGFLKDIPMGQRMKTVIEVWQEKEPDDWFEKLNICGKLITILPTLDYVFDLQEIIDASEESKDVPSEV